MKSSEPTGTLHQTFVTPCRSPSDRLNCDPVPPSLPSRPHSPPSLLRPYIGQDQRAISYSGYLKHSPFNNGAKVWPLDRHSDFKPQGTLVRHCPVRNMVHSTRRQLPYPGPPSPIGPRITRTKNIHTPVSPHLLHPHTPLNLHTSRAQIYRPHNHGIPDGRQNHHWSAHGPVSTASVLDNHSPGTLRSRTASPLWTTTSPVRSIAASYPRGMPHHPTSPHFSSKASCPQISEFSPSSPRISMNKTYLTSSPDDTTGLRPFQISDISSVQPSSFSERSRDRGFSSFSSPQVGLPSNLSEHESRYIKQTLKQTEDDEEFGYRGAVPFRIRSIHPQQRNTTSSSSSYPRDGGGSGGRSHHTPKYLNPGNRRSPNRHHNYEAQAQPPPPSPPPPAHSHPNHYHPNHHHHHHHHNHLHSSIDPLEGEESSDSSNQPFGYTRERFQKTVECVRQVPVHRPSSDEAAGLPYHFEAPGSQPPYRSLQLNDDNSRKVPSSHSFYSPRDSLSAGGSGHYPAHYCRSKLHFANSKGHPREGPQEESHTSMSSSGRGSILGRGHYPDVGGRASIKVDTLPDSYSSGLGSRSTSHSVPSSSCGQLRARPPMEITSASSLTIPHDYDVSIDSSPFLDASPSTRRDLSGDENYEFDSLTTHDAQEVVGPSFIGPRASAGHPYSTPDMVSPPELLLNAKDLYYSLYPKSRKPSRYSNSEKRFERLREEYYEYLRRQRLHSQPQILISMDSEML